MNSSDLEGWDWSASRFDRNPSILLALQPWVSLGFLDNQSPLLPILRLLCPLSYLHYPQICYIIIHLSQTRFAFPSSYKQSSFHHPSWYCSSFHSLYMAQPSYPLRFYEFHSIFPFINLFSSSLYLILQVSPSCSFEPKYPRGNRPRGTPWGRRLSTGEVMKDKTKLCKKALVAYFKGTHWHLLLKKKTLLKFCIAWMVGTLHTKFLHLHISPPSSPLFPCPPSRMTRCSSTLAHFVFNSKFWLKRLYDTETNKNAVQMYFL